MSYIEKNLMNGEYVLYRARLHWVVFLWPLVWFAVGVALLNQDTDTANLVGGLFLLIAFFKGADSLITYATSEFGVTDQRVIAKVGFIRRYSIEIFLAKLEAIQVNQTVSGRILGYGSVSVSGTGGTRDSFHNISDPFELKRKIQEQVPITR